jgi:hypothetical protein
MTPTRAHELYAFRFCCVWPPMTDKPLLSNGASAADLDWSQAEWLLVQGVTHLGGAL